MSKGGRRVKVAMNFLGRLCVKGGVSIVHTPSKNRHAEYEPVEQLLSPTSYR